MTDTAARSANVFTVECELDSTDPPGFRAGTAKVGAAIGGEELSVRVYEIPPGESLCPYHYEYVEEWLLILEGALTLRTPAGESELSRGSLVCFASGPDGAHKTTNHGAEPTRIMMFSSAHEPAVAVYPDSDKIGVWPGNRADTVMLRRADGQVDYYDGER